MFFHVFFNQTPSTFCLPFLSCYWTFYTNINIENVATSIVTAGQLIGHFWKMWLKAFSLKLNVFYSDLMVTEEIKLFFIVWIYKPSALNGWLCMFSLFLWYLEAIHINVLELRQIGISVGEAKRWSRRGKVWLYASSSISLTLVNSRFPTKASKGQHILYYSAN